MTESANPVRGEIALALGESGKEYVLRPTFAAIQAIEEKTGKGLLRLSRDGATGDLTLTETAIIANECIRAQGKATGDAIMAAYDTARVAELIHAAEGGIAATMGRLSVLLALAATGEYTPAGELKPVKEQMAESGPTH